MNLSQSAVKSLAGMWGSYDFTLITDKHFLTASELVERFIEKYTYTWETSSRSVDKELLENLTSVKEIITEWANKKIHKIIDEASVETIQTQIMFKQLHYGRGKTINFGSVGTHWKKKSEIAQELINYLPWSLEHAITSFKDKTTLYNHMISIVNKSNSPSEVHLFNTWWKLTNSTYRPMLFPQVQGHTSGKLFQSTSMGKSAKLYFDFGFINVKTKKKILIECDSRKYHSRDKQYQQDRDRQNIAERSGWSVRRFTYEDVIYRTDECFENLKPDLFYL